MRPRLKASLALVFCGLAAGCPPSDRLVLEEMGRPAFDPMRWEAGPAPEPQGPLPDELVFGITPYYSPERQAPALERIRAYLAEELGLEVKTRVSPSYEDVVVDLAAGRIDIAQLSPFAFVKARRRIDDLVPLATAVAQGSTSYASYLIVRSDSPFVRIDDAKGARLGFTDRWSTSGFVMPAAWLTARGLPPEEAFQVSWLGSHDRALDAVLAGTVDLAAVSSDTVVFERAVGVGGPVRILAKPGRIPYDAVVVRETMDPYLRWAVEKAFLTLSMHRPRGAEVLQDYNLINGFMPIPEGHYRRVAKMADSVEEPSGSRPQGGDATAAGEAR